MKCATDKISGDRVGTEKMDSDKVKCIESMDRTYTKLKHTHSQQAVCNEQQQQYINATVAQNKLNKNGQRIYCMAQIWRQNKKRNDELSTWYDNMVSLFVRLLAGLPAYASITKLTQYENK